MRKTIFELLRSSRPVLLMTVLVAVVGVTGTAYAGNHGSGDKKHGNDNSRGGKSNGNGNYDFGDHSSHKKHKGDRGAAYGVAVVNVARGGNPATVWARYSTRLGSPVGDTTGGVFRFTCSTANAPCEVSLGATVISDKAGSGQVYPRILIYRQDYDNGGPEVYCEYGDGSTGIAPLAIPNQPFSNLLTFSLPGTYTPVPVDIGNSADCNGPVTTAHAVNVITVPSGYYDVQSTFVFSS